MLHFSPDLRGNSALSGSGGIHIFSVRYFCNALRAFRACCACRRRLFVVTFIRSWTFRSKITPSMGLRFRLFNSVRSGFVFSPEKSLIVFAK